MTTQTQNQDVETLKEELARLRTDMAALVEAMKKNTGSTSKSSSKPAKDEIDSGQWENLKAKIEEARNQGEVINREISGEVRKHPLASIAIAFGVGYLASRIIK